MKKLQMNKEHRALIQSVIIENPKYKGNEELIDLFCELIYKKSYLLIDAIKDTARLKRHLVAICDNCLEQIIKEKKKFDTPKNKSQKTPSKIVSVRKEKTKPEEEFSLKNVSQEVVSLKEEIPTQKIDPFENLIDPIEYCPQKKVKEAEITALIEAVKQANKRYPKKKYYDIFFLRYVKCLEQTEIARELEISQSELSKRFVELIKLTSEKLK